MIGSITPRTIGIVVLFVPSTGFSQKLEELFGPHEKPAAAADDVLAEAGALFSTPFISPKNKPSLESGIGAGLARGARLSRCCQLSTMASADMSTWPRRRPADQEYPRCAPY